MSSVIILRGINRAIISISAMFVSSKTNQKLLGDFCDNFLLEFIFFVKKY